MNNRDGENTEEIYAVSLKDGREIGRITDQVEEYGVVRTKAFDTALKNADEANENVSGVTIGHDGSVYYYTRPNKKYSKQIIKSFCESLSNILMLHLWKKHLKNYKENMILY